mgnify:CR=1 FL=1
MSQKIWRVSGEYKKKKKIVPFTKEMLSDKEEHVKEKVYSEIGSRQKVKRRHIKFAEIIEIQPEEITDLDLRRLLGVELEL